MMALFINLIFMSHHYAINDVKIYLNNIINHNILRYWKINLFLTHCTYIGIYDLIPLLHQNKVSPHHPFSGAV